MTGTKIAPGGGVQPSKPFCLTQLSIKEIFSKVFGILKGQHVGGKSSERSYRSHCRLSAATNLCTSLETQGGAPGRSLPRASTQGASRSKSLNPLPIEFRRHRLVPNILGDDVPPHGTQLVEQDVRVNFTLTYPHEGWGRW